MTPRTGKQSRDRGEQFEADLLTAYRPAHVYLQRTSPPWRTVRKPGVGLVPVVIEEGVPDFHAAVEGRAMVLDAKATGDERWEFDHLEVAQAGHLADADARGVLTGILLRWDARQVVHWLPWPALAPRWYAWHRGTAARGGAFGWWWANFRLWVLDPDVTASDVVRAFWLQSLRESERDLGAASRGFFRDAHAYGKASVRAEAAADALNRYPYLWPVFVELLRDDDPHTWEARVAAKAAERYPADLSPTESA